MSAPNEASLQVSLHPLPILNVSEHYTRVSLQQSSSSIRVYGALLGTQRGREVEISNTFEFTVDAGLKVDHGYFSERRDQFKQVFPTLDFLGLYTNGGEPSADDLEVHKELLAYNESPLLLLVNPRSQEASKSLPVTIYEPIVELVKGEPTTVFQQVDYEIESGEAERIAVDHVSKPTGSGKGGAQSSLIAGVSTQYNAIQMLRARVQTIVGYLRAVEAGEAPKDHETLRQISSLVGRLPPMNALDLKEEFMAEYNDVLLTTYLATLTKQLQSANDLLDKHLLISPSSASGMGPGGRMRRGKGGSDFFGMMSMR